jgi:hypothetical protein
MFPVDGSLALWRLHNITNKMDKCFLRRFSIARIQPKLKKKSPDFFYIFLAFNQIWLNLPVEDHCPLWLPTYHKQNGQVLFEKIFNSQNSTKVEEKSPDFYTWGSSRGYFHI